MTQSMSLSLKNRSFLMFDRKVVIALIALSIAAIAWVVASRATAGINTTPQPNAVPNVAPNAATAPQEQPEQQLIKLRASGFEQTEVSRSGGQFVLVVEVGKDFRNEELALELKRADGGLVTELRVPEGMPVRSQEVNLQAGQYTLTVVNHPEWVCNITIQ